MKNFWAAYGATVWAAVFALLHLAWAFGWYIGLDETAASAAFERKWFLIYNIIAAFLCGLAAVVALAFVQSWSRRLPRLTIVLLGWCCSGILILRGGAATIVAVYQLASGKNSVLALSFWDLWFCLGAGLFVGSVWCFQRDSH